MHPSPKGNVKHKDQYGEQAQHGAAGTDRRLLGRGHEPSRHGAGDWRGKEHRDQAARGLGQACANYQDTALVDLPCTRVECDEIWSFCYARAKNVPVEHAGGYGYGDVWTWTATCADTKLVPSWYVGKRDTEDAFYFMSDLKARLTNRVQLSTDGHKPYLRAVEATLARTWTTP